MSLTLVKMLTISGERRWQRQEDADNQLSLWSIVQEQSARGCCQSVVKHGVTDWPVQASVSEQGVPTPHCCQRTHLSGTKGQEEQGAFKHGLEGTGREREGCNQDSITTGLTGACLVCSTLQK